MEEQRSSQISQDHIHLHCLVGILDPSQCVLEDSKSNSIVSTGSYGTAHIRMLLSIRHHSGHFHRGSRSALRSISVRAVDDEQHSLYQRHDDHKAAVSNHED